MSGSSSSPSDKKKETGKGSAKPAIPMNQLTTLKKNCRTRYEDRLARSESEKRQLLKKVL